MGKEVEYEYEYPKLRNKKIKNREDIPILKDIPVVMVDKYWIEVTKEYQEEVLNIGYKLFDEYGNHIATVIDILKNKALLQTPIPINYFEAVRFGIDMDHIVFDQEQTWFKCQNI